MPNSQGHADLPAGVPAFCPACFLRSERAAGKSPEALSKEYGVSLEYVRVTLVERCEHRAGPRSASTAWTPNTRTRTPPPKVL